VKHSSHVRPRQCNRLVYGCNPESLAAYAQVQPTEQQTYDQIMAVADQCGHHGIIPDEVTALWQCSPNHVAPRITELKKRGLLVEADRRRPTRAGGMARVLVAKQFARPGAPTIAPPPQSRAELPTRTESLFGKLAPENRYPWRDPEEG
jgi:hypothetical protein